MMQNVSSSTTLPISYPVDSNAIQTTATYQANATISAYVVNRCFWRGREHSIEIKNSESSQITMKVSTVAVHSSKSNAEEEQWSGWQ
eukprot:scaffold14195_cov155-Skeletonema_dohrnii-CCMP3373.AAC.4